MNHLGYYRYLLCDALTPSPAVCMPCRWGRRYDGFAAVLVALSLLSGCVQATASCEPPCQEWADRCAGSSEAKAIGCVQECKAELDRYVTLECKLTYASCEAPVRYDCEVLP